MDLSQELPAVAHADIPYADYSRGRARSLPASVSSAEYGRIKRPALAFRAALITLAILAGTACKRAEPPAPPPPEVLVTEVIQKDVPISAEWVGTTVGFVNAKVMPRVQGYLLKQDYEDGANVKAGQLLFEIDDRPYKASLDQALGDLATQRANLRKNQQDVARYTPLAAQGAVSKQELDDAIQATRASEAQVQAAEAAVTNARLNLDWTKSLLADRRHRRNRARPGRRPRDPVDRAHQRLADRSDEGERSRSPSASTCASPIRSRSIRRRASAQDEPDLQLILADGSAYPHPGRFYVANREVDRQTGTILVQALFPNPDGILRPGLYAKVRAATETVRGALLVPERAVQEIQGTYQVAVVGSDDKVALRTVKMGQQLDGLWVVERRPQTRRARRDAGPAEGEGRDRRERQAGHVRRDGVSATPGQG